MRLLIAVLADSVPFHVLLANNSPESFARTYGGAAACRR